MLDLSSETEALARSLAEARRVTVDVAVRGALEAQSLRTHPETSSTTRDSAAPREEALRKFRETIFATTPKKDVSPEAVADRLAATKRIVAEISALPLIDTRSVQEIVDDINEL